MIDPFYYAMAGFGLDVFGGLTSQNQAYEQQAQMIELQNQQAAQMRAYENAQIQKQNEYTAMVYETQKQLYSEQLKLNSEAADRAYQGIYMNRNRQLTAMAFARQDRDMQLLEAVGAGAAAIEGDNRSAELALAKKTYGREGVMRAQEQLAIRDVEESTKLNVQDTYGQLKAANQQAYAQVAIPPYMQSMLPPAAMMPMPSGPSGLSTGLMIGDSLMSGMGVYNSLAAPQDKLFG